MNNPQAAQSSPPTAVDDVRRVRERLARESEDMQQHIAQSNRVLEQFREKLGIKVVQPPPRPIRKDGTAG